MKYIHLVICYIVIFSFASGQKELVNQSIKQEIERSLNMGLKWLSQEQNKTSGNWGLDEYPALTGLAVRCFLGHPSKHVPQKYEKSLIKGLDFIRSKFSRMEVFMVRVLHHTIPQFICSPDASEAFGR